MINQKGFMRRYHSHSSHPNKPVNDIVYTPKWVAEIMITWLAPFESCDKILDPCCGRNMIFKEVYSTNKPYPSFIDGFVSIDICDPSDDLYIDILPVSTHFNTDFLSLQPDRTYDKIIMNPPFSNNGIWKFIYTCFNKWLAPGGRIVSIIQEAVIDNAESRKAWLNRYMKRYMILPKNTFKESGLSTFHGGIALFEDTDSPCIFTYYLKDDKNYSLDFE